MKHASTTELVALALFDHGPCDLNTISLITGLGLPLLRLHLTINRGDRYLATLTIEDGVPIRRWRLNTEKDKA
ncbi:MAG: hypothetical protein V4457_11780 [Pseudomonadota bacterium]